MSMWTVLALVAALQQPRAPVPAPAPIIARDSTLDRVAREVSSGLRCPVCQGLSIQDSPADLAVEMKHLVREQLAQGRTPDQVRAYFIEKYGEWVLLEPEPQGFNLLVYALPLLLLTAGGYVVVRFVRRHVDPGVPSAGQGR
ncbi:MAG: cytochrome c-type biogenesis protein CcmH [Gemmatimonadaceae bacterium]|nr:cytochrome c-type biogenesis protein CcmH [Gemmatimonadaceae bacterium]